MKEQNQRSSGVPDTSTTLLRDVADSQHARWAVFHSRYEPMMQAFSDIRFGGPETIRGYNRLRRREREDLLRRATQSSSRNFASPRWISSARGKYRRENKFYSLSRDWCDSRTEYYGLAKKEEGEDYFEFSGGYIY